MTRETPIPMWEPTDVVRFSYDAEHDLRFQCPHHPTAHRLPLGPPDGWQIVQAEPLTVRPSILIRDCGCHGFIVEGKWESC